MEEKIKVFAIEDSVVNAKMIQRALTAQRFQLDIYTSGEEGVDAIQHVTPDVVLMDVTLPGINGYEACRRIRENPRLQLVPIVFLSARSSTEEKIKGYQSGGDDYLTKPFVLEELATKILKHAEIGRSRRNLATKFEEALKHKRWSDSRSNNLQTTLKFIEHIGVCHTLDDMITCTFEALLKWGLRSTLQIRLPERLITVFDDNRHRELEVEAIKYSHYLGRIIEFGPRCFVNYCEVSLLIKNMPPACEMRDPLHEYLIGMVEALHGRIITQALEETSQLHWRQVMGLLSKTHVALNDAHSALSMLLKENHNIFDTILSNIEASLSDMHLTETHENTLMSLVRSGEASAEELFRKVLREDERICQIVTDLEHLNLKMIRR